MLDPSEEVAEAALSVLRKMKENSIFLKTFAKCEPILELLKKSAKDILFEMLQFNEVVDYLVKTSFLDNLISEWHSIQCSAYIENLEMTIENHQYLFFIRSDEMTDTPRHLFHCLAQTPGGLGFLLKKGNISEFVRILDESKFEDVPQLKIAAVNLANVASTEGGLSLLDSMSKSPIIPTFVTRFMECSDLCLKR